MFKRLRPAILIACLIAAAVAVIWLASYIALTLDRIESRTILWIYSGTVGALIVGVVAAALLIIRPRRPKRAHKQRLSAAQRLDHIFAESGFAESRPLTGYAPIKRGEFCDPEPDQSGRLLVAICGTARVGKSALHRALEASLPTVLAERLDLRELPSLGTDAKANAEILRAIGAAALVVFVADQDLRSFEFDALRHAVRSRRPIVVAINKADLFRADELSETKAAVAEKLREMVPREDIVAIAAEPAQALRVAASADGIQRTAEVARATDIGQLVARVEQQLRRRVAHAEG